MDQIASAFDQDDAVVLEIDESEVKPRWGVQTDRHPPHIALRRVVADGGRQRRKVIFNPTMSGSSTLKVEGDRPVDAKEKGCER